MLKVVGFSLPALVTHSFALLTAVTLLSAAPVSQVQGNPERFAVELFSYFYSLPVIRREGKRDAYTRIRYSRANRHYPRFAAE
jgi:hypothetical protein